MSDAYTLNIQGLDALLSALKGKPPQARIGILGGSTREVKPGEKSKPTNAEVGAAHEFGAPARGLPQRSFLRVPLTDHLEKYMEKSGLLDKQALNDVLKKKSLLPWVKKMATVAETVVQDAFDTGGFGKWPAHKPGHENNANMLLVDTHQLRDSITSEVKE